MRTVKTSLTFYEDLEMLLGQGLPRYGKRVLDQKRILIFRAIEDHILFFPVRPVDPILGVCAYPVSKTPFVLLYDYDDIELRVHLIIHGSADRSKIDLKSVVW